MSGLAASEPLPPLKAAIWGAVTHAIRTADRPSDGRLEQLVNAALAVAAAERDLLAVQLAAAQGQRDIFRQRIKDAGDAIEDAGYGAGDVAAGIRALAADWDAIRPELEELREARADLSRTMAADAAEVAALLAGLAEYRARLRAADESWTRLSVQRDRYQAVLADIIAAREMHAARELADGDFALAVFDALDVLAGAQAQGDAREAPEGNPAPAEGGGDGQR